MKNKQAKFEKLLDGYSINQVQNAYLFIKHLDSVGIDPSEFKAFARKFFNQRAKMVKALNKRLGKVRISIPCPECKKELIIQSINIPEGKNNLNGWRSVLRCVECTYENYSVIQVNKRITKIKRSRRII